MQWVFGAAGAHRGLLAGSGSSTGAATAMCEPQPPAMLAAGRLLAWPANPQIHSKKHIYPACGGQMRRLRRHLGAALHQLRIRCGSAAQHVRQHAGTQRCHRRVKIQCKLRSLLRAAGWARPGQGRRCHRQRHIAARPARIAVRRPNDELAGSRSYVCWHDGATGRAASLQFVCERIWIVTDMVVGRERFANVSSDAVALDIPCCHRYLTYW